MRLKAVSAVMALGMFGGLANATPVEYSFDLTVTELRIGDRPDPYYSRFHPGQKFHGTFAYDPSTAVEGGRGYLQTTSLTVKIDDTLVSTRYGLVDYEPAGTFINLIDGPDGGADSFFMFEEVPYAIGGYLGNFQAEQFYINLIDEDGTAISSTVPGPIDFTRFDSGSWNFWSWGNEALYSSLLMYGTVDNIREVPEPGPLSLAAFAIVGLGVMRALRRRSAGSRLRTAHPKTSGA